MLPSGFIAMLGELGLDRLPYSLENEESPVSVRLNPSKPGAVFSQCEPVGWCPEGLYLPRRPRFTLDPLLHAGCYYVQEAASMFHSHIVRSIVPHGSLPLRVLDACAAPGGKTTAVLSALPEGSVILANEYVPARAAALKENLIKWGRPEVIVTRGDTVTFSSMPDAFDIIVADVPCSGEGMMRKDPRAAEQWSRGLIAECAERQRVIISNLWPSLRPGGWLIYSTCTFNRTENEEMVEWIISEYGAESVEIDVDRSWGVAPGIGTGAHCYRFIPGVTRGEGLFAAVLRKPGTLREGAQVKDKRSKSAKPAQIPPQVRDWIENPGNMDFSLAADRIWAFPPRHADLLKRVATSLDVIHEGVPIATLKGRDVIPSHALALSTILAPGAFNRAEVTLPDALAYLRGEAIHLPGAPKGYNLVCYQGHPLGFVKNLGNRTNNLYPQPYRIRKQCE